MGASGADQAVQTPLANVLEVLDCLPADTKGPRSARQCERICGVAGSLESATSNGTLGPASTENSYACRARKTGRRAF
jgi:hypothetical protein